MVREAVDVRSGQEEKTGASGQKLTHRAVVRLVPEHLGRHVAVAAGLPGQVVSFAGARAAGGAAVAVVGGLRARPVALLQAALLSQQAIAGQGEGLCQGLPESIAGFGEGRSRPRRGSD